MATLIKDGTIVTATDIYSADILIDEGVISCIGSNLEAGASDIIDASNKYIFPGGVDPHCHLDFPFAGTVSSDDYEAGTVAAACGGTTCIIDVAFQEKGKSLAHALRTWQGRAKGEAVIDYGFHVDVVDPNASTLAELADMTDAGVTSFKVFMAYPESLMVDDAGLLRVLSRAKELGALVIFHAENGSIIDVLTKRALAEGNTSPRYHALCHPRIAEAEAVNRAIMLARLVETPIYFYHISSEMALAPIKEAQGLGLPVFAETCPHYLFLAEDKYQSSGFEGAKYNCSPPLRDLHDQDTLWNALVARNIQVVSSDHVAFNFHGQKDLGRDDFSRIPGGVPGVETRLPLLYSGVARGRIGLTRFVELTSTAPAKLFGLYPKKGTISIGSDADVVIFDPEKELTLSVETLHQQVDYTPYEGLELRGAPSIVLSKGKVVVQDGTFVGETGAGQYLGRKPFSSR